MTRAARAAGPALLAVAAGLALLVSHPPVGLWPATFLAPPLFIGALTLDERRAEHDRQVARGFRLGALMGLAAFGPMLSWLILPAGVAGWSLLVLIQASWMGLLGACLRPFLRHASMPFVAAAAWTGIEAWRSIFPLNGFGWGAISYAHVDGSWMLPVARLVGGRGITFLVVLVGAAAFVAVTRTWTVVRARDGAPVEAALGTTTWPVAIMVGGLLVSVMATIEPPPETGSIDVLVAQGNDVRHWERDVDDPDAPLRITTALRDLTLEAVDRDGSPDLTVWPESSVDRDPWSQRGAPLAALAGEAASASGVLLTGASLHGPDPETERYITALRLEGGFDETDRYTKRRLVPFGEYIPARPLFDWFPPLEQVPRDAQPGSGPQTVELVDGVRAAVVICFETLFGGIVRSNVLADPDAPAQVLITMTNDASFGDSAEPAQHLAQTRLRAVETGRWAVHGALSGSSAFVDPHGRTYQDTALFERAVIRHDVPLVEGRTPYLVIGDVLGTSMRLVTAALALFALVVAIRRRRASQPEL